MKSPVKWLGGKGRIVSNLMPLIPLHKTYVEPFGGGASLLFAKDPSPVEVYNDIDDGLVGFFRLLRDPDAVAKLTDLLDRTPYSRSEWQECKVTWRLQTDPIERARRWFVVVWQGFGRFFGHAWGYVLYDGDVSHAFRQATSNLFAASRRLIEVQVECCDWPVLLTRYDSPDTFFYLDPPYAPSTRSRSQYPHEMDEAGHVKLTDRLLSMKGMMVLSGYPHPGTIRLVDAGWRDVEIPASVWSQRRGDAGYTPADEHVWISPSCKFGTAGDIFDLFGE